MPSIAAWTRAPIQQLLTDYQSKASSADLVATYHLGKGTILNLLERHNISIRRTRPLNQPQVDQAIELYARGMIY